MRPMITKCVTSTIEHADIFINDKKIVFEFTALTASDIESISLFLTSSFNKKWKSLELWVCAIQDKGLNVLYHGLCHGNAIAIDKLILTDNSLTVQLFSLISKIIVNCKVKDLSIGGNNSIGEDQQLYSTLSNPSVLLEQLSIGDTQLSTTAAIDLFTALEYNNILKQLYIAHNNITDDACDAIIIGLERKSGWIASYSTTLLKDDDIVAAFL